MKAASSSSTSTSTPTQKPSWKNVPFPPSSSSSSSSSSNGTGAAITSTASKATSTNGASSAFPTPVSVRLDVDKLFHAYGDANNTAGFGVSVLWQGLLLGVVCVLCLVVCVKWYAVQACWALYSMLPQTWRDKVGQYTYGSSVSGLAAGAVKGVGVGTGTGAGTTGVEGLRVRAKSWTQRSLLAARPYVRYAVHGLARCFMLVAPALLSIAFALWQLLLPVRLTLQLLAFWLYHRALKNSVLESLAVNFIDSLALGALAVGRYCFPPSRGGYEVTLTSVSGRKHRMINEMKFHIGSSFHTAAEGHLHPPHSMLHSAKLRRLWKAQHAHNGTASSNSGSGSSSQHGPRLGMDRSTVVHAPADVLDLPPAAAAFHAAVARAAAEAAAEHCRSSTPPHDSNEGEEEEHPSSGWVRKPDLLQSLLSHASPPRHRPGRSPAPPPGRASWANYNVDVEQRKRDYIQQGGKWTGARAGGKEPNTP